MLSWRYASLEGDTAGNASRSAAPTPKNSAIQETLAALFALGSEMSGFSDGTSRHAMSNLQVNPVDYLRRQLTAYSFEGYGLPPESPSHGSSRPSVPLIPVSTQGCALSTSQAREKLELLHGQCVRCVWGRGLYAW